MWKATTHVTKLYTSNGMRQVKINSDCFHVGAIQDWLISEICGHIVKRCFILISQRSRECREQKQKAEMLVLQRKPSLCFCRLKLPQNKMKSQPSQDPAVAPVLRRSRGITSANLRRVFFFFFYSPLICIMHSDTHNQEGHICIDSCLNFPVDMVAVFVISPHFDSQRKLQRQGGYSWIHKTTAKLMGTMFTDFR